MKKSRYPVKGVAPREEKTAPKSSVGWCTSCRCKRMTYGGRCLACNAKVDA